MNSHSPADLAELDQARAAQRELLNHRTLQGYIFWGPVLAGIVTGLATRSRRRGAIVSFVLWLGWTTLNAASAAGEMARRGHVV